MINKNKIKEKISFTIKNLTDIPSRLDNVLFKRFPLYSRSYFQILVKNNLIKVNNKIVIKNSYKPTLDDVIEVSFPEEKSFDLKPQNINLEIIDQQKDFIIINKPAGLMVHPSPNNEDDKSVVAGLLYKFSELKDFHDRERPGIVHRLDQNTSGLLITVRNIPTQISFSKMFQNREINKTYLAVVKGHPNKGGKIDFDIGRHPKKRHMMSHLGISPKTAVTYYKVLVYYKDCSLVEVRIITGRTHQIRVHLAAIGHGVIGDPIYGYQSKQIKRQALHAWKLDFEYKNKKYSYVKPVPEDMVQLLKTLNNRELSF